MKNYPAVNAALNSVHRLVGRDFTDEEREIAAH
jgi:hypothetical protein